MAKYNVPITLGDGEVINVSVDADNIAEARRKALVGEETGATAGTPVLAPEPSSSSLTPTGFRERRPGESATDYLRYRQGLPPLDSPSSLTVEDLNPDLYDAGSSTYVEPQNFTNFVSNLAPFAGGEEGMPDMAIPQYGEPEKPLEDLTLEELKKINPDIFDPQSSTFVPPTDGANQVEKNEVEEVVDPLEVVGDSLPFNLSDQDLFNISSDAGYQRAFGNVFGDDITSRGPLSGYFDRQRQGLTNAFRAKSLVDYLNDFALDQEMVNAGLQGPTRHNYTSTTGRLPDGTVGAVGPDAFDPTAPVAFPGSNPLQNQFVPQSGTFESFLRERQADPRGLNSAYANALQNYQTLRGLSASQAPESLSYLFSPTQYGDVQNAFGMLEAAQRGKYSPLVSSLFRTPSFEKAFGDYTLASQDRAKQGLGAQNFFDFAAPSFGL